MTKLSVLVKLTINFVSKMSYRQYRYNEIKHKIKI